MLKKTFNQLLDTHFSTPVESSKLETLEHDVMQRIHILKAENQANWYEKIISALCVPQFQFASIAVALFIGIGLSPILINNSENNIFLPKDLLYSESHLSLSLNEYLG